VPPKPKVIDGDVVVLATLRGAADSAQANQTVRDLRTDLDSVGRAIKVGGDTAIQLDSRDTSTADRNRIIPTILLVIFVVLALLLRALLAPVLLLLANVLSFGATMGVSALVFEHVLDFPATDPSIPLIGFVFLVALGIDYSIFLMTRVREESIRQGTHPGVLKGLSVTGGVITSAGVVLAATFAALGVIPILFLAQLAFIVAFGVLLDTIVVRSLLVPALCYDLGPRIWWPSRLWHTPDHADAGTSEMLHLATSDGASPERSAASPGHRARHRR
jgi:RND superfamily putative drug exporter